MSDVEVSTEIAADPKVVYDLVSDLPRMGEWSPENTGGRWLAGATGAAVGARFRGTNRRGPLWWATTCTVTAADPGEHFAFDVSSGPLAVSTWDDRFTRDGDETVVVESWTERRPAWMRLASIPLMGVADRAAHNQRSMQATLAALKRAAEG